ncbi:MAG: hypothetical protein V4649_10925 [Bacteroidota bacterium]
MNGTKLPTSLTDIILGAMRERPLLFFGQARISNLADFISGYSTGFYAARNSQEKEDEFFSDDSFIEWFYKKKNLENGGSWRTPFLEEANGDEAKALLIFFEYLEQYKNEAINKK